MRVATRQDALESVRDLESCFEASHHMAISEIEFRWTKHTAGLVLIAITGPKIRIIDPVACLALKSTDGVRSPRCDVHGRLWQAI